MNQWLSNSLFRLMGFSIESYRAYKATRAGGGAVSLGIAFPHAKWKAMIVTHRAGWCKLRSEKPTIRERLSKAVTALRGKEERAIPLALEGMFRD